MFKVVFTKCTGWRSMWRALPRSAQTLCSGGFVSNNSWAKRPSNRRAKNQRQSHFWLIEVGGCIRIRVLELVQHEGDCSLCSCCQLILESLLQKPRYPSREQVNFVEFVLLVLRAPPFHHSLSGGLQRQWRQSRYFLDLKHGVLL